MITCASCGRTERPTRYGNCAVVDESWPHQHLPQRARDAWVQEQHAELAAVAATHEGIADQEFAAVAARVRRGANTTPREQLIARGYIPRDLTKPPAIPRSWWTPEERARVDADPVRDTVDQVAGMPPDQVLAVLRGLLDRVDDHTLHAVEIAAHHQRRQRRKASAA